MSQPALVFEQVHEVQVGPIGQLPTSPLAHGDDQEGEIAAVLGAGRLQRGRRRSVREVGQLPPDGRHVRHAGEVANGDVEQAHPGEKAQRRLEIPLDAPAGRYRLCVAAVTVAQSPTADRLGDERKPTAVTTITIPPGPTGLARLMQLNNLSDRRFTRPDV